MKKQLRDFWEKESTEQAITFLDTWCNYAENSGIKEVKRISNTLMYTATSS